MYISLEYPFPSLYLYNVCALIPYVTDLLSFQVILQYTNLVLAKQSDNRVMIIIPSSYNFLLS